MNEFEHIKHNWQNKTTPALPKNGAELIIRNAKNINRNQLFTKIILGITIVILLIFFFSVSAYKNTTASTALIIMILSLFIRVVIEIVFKLKNVNEVSLNATDFKTRFVNYRKQRLFINYVITPILYVAYIVGFVLILPSFKASLSAEFYNYIVYSSIVIFLILAIVIWRAIRKEHIEIQRLIYMSNTEN